MSVHPMISIVRFESRLADQVAMLWRILHPDWRWLDDPETRTKVFEPSEGVDRIGYVVQRAGAVIATVLGTCGRGQTWARNRYINIEARPEDIEAVWLSPLLAKVAEADREHPGTWQVASLGEALRPVLAPFLEATGFVYHSSTMRTEWKGDAVAVLDPSPARFERYGGGDPEIDAAIVDLHNRSQRSSRLMPPIARELLWTTVPGLIAHEYVLLRDEGRLVGHAEWLVVDGKAYINSLVVARSHWGTEVAASLGFETIRILLELGHRTIESSLISTNVPAVKLHVKCGGRVAAEQMRNYVRKI
jgi:hypothetical protein